MKKRSMLVALAIVAQIGIGALLAQSVVAQGARGGRATAAPTVTGSGLAGAGSRNPVGSVISPPPPAP